MTKRPSLIDRLLAGLDAKIAELQQTRQHLIDVAAALERRRRPATIPHTDLSGTVDSSKTRRRRTPADPPAITEKVE
jgi:hypothetical protein